MSVVPAALSLLACAKCISFARKARGCGQHPAFPAPSYLSRATNDASLGHFVPRECGVVAQSSSAGIPRDACAAYHRAALRADPLAGSSQDEEIELLPPPAV